MTVWGEATHGGYIPRALQPSSVASVVLGCRALAVLLTDGRVQSFGDAQWGGDTWWNKKKCFGGFKNKKPRFYCLAFFRCVSCFWLEGGGMGEMVSWKDHGVKLWVAAWLSLSLAIAQQVNAGVVVYTLPGTKPFQV